MRTALSDIDAQLAAALRGDEVAWPSSSLEGLVVERILYHGIAGLLASAAQQSPSWPASIAGPVRRQATAQAMWELRHQSLLSNLLGELARNEVVGLLVKGTAVAYDLYPQPAQRVRGDTDLWIDATDLDQARAALTQAGFVRCGTDETLPGDAALQEGWVQAADGVAHHIDLHWRLMNSAALRDLFLFDEQSAARITLHRLGETAFAMDRVHTFLHTAAHRKMHLTAPYFVDGKIYYGGDRLIWLYDLHLLAKTFRDEEWRQLCDAAASMGLAPVCLEALATAAHLLATRVPTFALDLLAAAPGGKATDYLLGSHQAGRAWRDLAAVGGLPAKFSYIRSRVWPSRAFIRAKYPALAHQPLLLLYARRIVEWVLPRPSAGDER